MNTPRPIAPRPSAARPGAPRLSATRLAELMDRPAPTDEQIAVIEAPLAPMLVVAGAGSGKTETMASRVVWLIANGLVEPRQVLGLTFTRKAAHELAERITGRLGTLATALRADGLPVPRGLERAGDDLLGQEVQVHTYNGFALDLVREHALRVGLDPEFSMMSPSAAWQLAHELVEAADDSLDLDASPASLTAALVSLTSSLADHLVGPEELAAELRAIRDHLSQIPLQISGRRRTTPKDVAGVISACEQRLELIPLLERFAAIRTERSALEFSDQVYLAARIAREVPEAGRLARELHPVVLLDEFQDTSVAQLRMLADLFGPGHAACAVGDPQQAIYGWRGASAASLDGFARAFATPTAPGATGAPGAAEAPVLQRTLSTSWRNDRAVLDVANRIAAPLRSASTAITIPELQVRPGAGEGTVHVHEAADERSEARAIARWILARRGRAGDATDARVHPSGAAGEGGPASEPLPSAAVLVRARKQIPPIVEALEEAGLPVQVMGLGGLLDRPEVADVRALLECVHDPGRGDWLMRLLAGPRFRLGARDMSVLGRWREQLAARRRRAAAGADATDRSSAAGVGATGIGAADGADEMTLIDAVDDLPAPDWTDPDGRSLSSTARERLRDLQGILRSLRRRLALPLPDLIQEAVRALDLDLTLLSQSPTDPPLGGLPALREHAAAFERTAQRPGLGPFLALLEISEDQEAGLAMGAGQADPDPDAITVVTMHSAKGLEWDLVAVAGLSEGSVPSYDLRRAKTTEDGSVRVADSGWTGKLAEASIPSSLRGDADILPQLDWASADTQVDAESLVQEFRFAQGEETLREDRRLMYVAVTRAREDLLLSSCAWRTGAARPRPRSRYLRETLPLVPERFQEIEDVPEKNPLDARLFEASWPPAPGEAERRRADAEALVRAAADGRLPELPEDAALAEQTRRVLADLAERRAQLTVRSPARLSASQIVARAQDPQAAARSMLRPLPRRPSRSARRGTAFHAWLEQRLEGGALLDLEDLTELADLEDGPLADAADGDPGATADGELSDAEALARMREAFERSPYAQQVPIAVEEPVTTRIGPLAIRGVIDAVFPDPDSEDGVVILDWKTGAPPSGARRRARALQLSVYRLAWHERTGLPLSRIRTVFFYVAAGKTDEVRRHPSRQALEHMLLAEGDAPTDAPPTDAPPTGSPSPGRP
ncbi:ATP-dependent DNA helicase [Brachybacterium kimchii]|uniref:DNA 3'-5' helicase n=1 Tax=Brachybacterium kimchii TaxID=2942909 RepID=A0ABY4NCJ6_9MICO|nr:ATP-dependent DNA helicase [Brachybacterium kimchii]UQN31189.1 ATP-dependent helicase [Brachybacterium kimchii]